MKIDERPRDDHSHPYAHVVYDGAGHLFLGPYRDYAGVLTADHCRGTPSANAPAAGDAWVRTLDYLEAAIRNVVENAVEHNDHDDFRVTVAATWTGEGLRTEISETGDGISELEQQVLRDGLETPLHHGPGPRPVAHTGV